MRAALLVLAALSLAISSARTGANAAEPAPLVKACALVGQYPDAFLQATVPSSPHVVAFDLVSSGTLSGRQLVFENTNEIRDRLLSSEAYIERQPPRVRCFVPNDVIVSSRAWVDVGPDVTVESIYLGKGSLTASFYAYEEDFFSGRHDEGLVNESFGVQVDRREPSQVQVTAKPGQTVTLRFDGITAGHHVVTFGPINDAEGQRRIMPLRIVELDLPPELSAQP